MEVILNQEVALLRERYGIEFPGAVDFRNSQIGMDAALALFSDAMPTNLIQSPLVTVGNAAVPAYLTNYLDPELVRVLTAPIRAAEILGGEAKKGDWTTKTAEFPIIESTGEVSSYGDANNNGLAGANVNWEPRQSYHYQAFAKWGDKELDTAGKGKIDWAAEQNLAVAVTFAKFQNKSYFFGVNGLENYGILNDPSLPASITPGKAWASSTGLEIWGDIQKLFTQLQTQLNGNVDMTDKLTLAMSPTIQPYLLTAMQNVYGNATVLSMIKEGFPNMVIKTAPEYETTAGQVVQMIVESVQGQKVGFCGFTEKMRAHAIVRDTSMTYQKKSAGTWGAIIKVPAGISSMLGV